MSDLLGHRNDHTLCSREILWSLKILRTAKLQVSSLRLPTLFARDVSIGSKKTFIESNASDTSMNSLLDFKLSLRSSYQHRGVLNFPYEKKLFSYLLANLNRGNNHFRLSLGFEFFVLKGAVKTLQWFMELNFIKNIFRKGAKVFIRRYENFSPW